MPKTEIDKTQPLAVAHFSPIKGLTGNEQRLTLIHYGFTYRVPAREINTPKHLQLEQRKLDAIRRLIANPPPKFEYFAGGTIERFDIYDADSQDLIVMIRVPFRSIAA